MFVWIWFTVFSMVYSLLFVIVYQNRPDFIQGQDTPDNIINSISTIVFLC